MSDEIPRRGDDRSGRDDALAGAAGAAQKARTWTTIAAYKLSRGERPALERAIAALRFKPYTCATLVATPLMAASAIRAAARELGAGRTLARVAFGGAHGPVLVSVGRRQRRLRGVLFGLELDGGSERTRVYLIDTGTAAVPLLMERRAGVGWPW